MISKQQQDQSENFDSLIYSLDKSNMTNKHHYKNVICLSQRIQHKISQLKRLQARQRHNNRKSDSYQCSKTTKYEQAQQQQLQHTKETEDDDILLLTSPTETIIAYYDEYFDHTDNNRVNKLSPKLIIQQPHSVMYYDGNKKPLPPLLKAPPLLPTKNNSNSIKSNSLYQNNGQESVDSAIDLVNNGSNSTLYLLPKYYYTPTTPISSSHKPLPSIRHNPIQNITIIHVKKKYNGLKGFITRTYQLAHFEILSKSYTFSPKQSPATALKLFACREKKSTRTSKAILKVTLTTSVHNGLYIIPYFEFTFYHVKSLMMTKSQKLLDISRLCSTIQDEHIRSALLVWLEYYHDQLPSIQNISHILRQDLKIYIIYNIF